MKKILVLILSIAFQFPLSAQVFEETYKCVWDSSLSWPVDISNNIDSRGNFFTGFRLNYGMRTYGLSKVDTIIDGNAYSGDFFLMKKNPEGKLVWIKHIPSFNQDVQFLTGAIQNDRFHMFFASMNNKPLILFDGVTIPNNHRESIYHVIIDTNAKTQIAILFSYSDSVSSFFYPQQIIPAPDGDFFVCGSWGGKITMGNQTKVFNGRDVFGSNTIHTFVGRMDEDGMWQWFNDSIESFFSNDAQMSYSDHSKELLITSTFADTLWYNNVPVLRATNPVVSNSEALMACTIDSTGKAIDWHNFDSYGARCLSVSPLPGGEHQLVIKTTGWPLYVDSIKESSNDLIWTYKIETKKRPKLEFTMPTYSDKFFLRVHKGLKSNLFFNLLVLDSNSLFGDKFVSIKPGIYNSTIRNISSKTILQKIEMQGNKGVFGEIIFQNSAYTLLDVTFSDTLWVNGQQFIGESKKATTLTLKVANKYINGIEPNKLKKSGHASITTRLTLFPNPAQGKVTASWQPGNQYPTQVSICDGVGNALLTQTASAFTNVVSFDTSNLKPGLYFVFFDNKLWKDGRTLLIQE